MDNLNALPKLLSSTLINTGTPEEFLKLMNTILGLSRQVLSIEQEAVLDKLGQLYGQFFTLLISSFETHEEEVISRTVAASSIIAVISHRKNLIYPVFENSPKIVNNLVDTLDKCSLIGIEYASPVLLAIEGVAFYDKGKELILRVKGVTSLSNFLIKNKFDTSFKQQLLGTALEALSNTTIPIEAIWQLPSEGEENIRFLNVLMAALSPPSSVTLVHAALGVVLNMARDRNARYRLMKVGANKIIAKCITIPDQSILKLALTTLLSVSRENISSDNLESRSIANKALGEALASAMLLDISDELLGAEVFDEQKIIADAGIQKQNCENDLDKLFSSFSENNDEK